MTNAGQAYPSVVINCKDRPRTFCLNLGAFRAMEQHLSEKNQDENYSIIEDFDWSSNTVENLSLIVWGGLFTDAKKDPEPFTIEVAEEIVSLVGVTQIRACVESSLEKVMSPKQFAKIQEDAEKKRKGRAAKSQKKAKKIG